MALEIGMAQIIIIILQIITLFLSLKLLNIYRKSYKEIKIGYTVGLIVFAALILLKNIAQLSLSILFLSTGDQNIMIQDVRIFPTIIELIAIGVLYKITTDY
ncbi:MAG: hypothetical protein FWH29_05850 [Methanobrevibacter sp.]|nr:hypothetical protein [Methanobrevibacter sp.]